MAEKIVYGNSISISKNKKGVKILPFWQKMLRFPSVGCILLSFILILSPYTDSRRPYRLMVRTRPSQGCNPGSTPGRVMVLQK